MAAWRLSPDIRKEQDKTCHSHMCVRVQIDAHFQHLGVATYVFCFFLAQVGDIVDDLDHLAVEFAKL